MGAGAGVLAQGTAGAARQATGAIARGVIFFFKNSSSKQPPSPRTVTCHRSQGQENVPRWNKNPFCTARCTQNALARLWACPAGCRVLPVRPTLKTKHQDPFSRQGSSLWSVCARGGRREGRWARPGARGPPRGRGWHTRGSSRCVDSL